MNTQPAPHARSRCKQHGLVVNHDGACPLCAGDARHGLFRIVAVVVALAAISGAFWWRKTPKEAAEESSATRAPYEPVRLAPATDPERPRTTTLQASPSEWPPPALHIGAEDRHLDEAVLQPPAMAAAPSNPPRATVDPEPVPPDDPSDFQLPAR